jgi:iron(III) transport system permease protein
LARARAARFPPLAELSDAGVADTPAAFTWLNYAKVYTSVETFRLLGNSLAFAAGAAALSLAIGTALAWMNERTNTPFKSLIYALSVVPLVIPGILFVAAWIMLASPKIGVLNLLLQRAFGTDRVFFDVYTLPGMMWVDGIQHAPVAFLLMSAALRSMDPSLEESALMSGASMFQVARRITLKLAFPALAASFLILFVRSIESFENPRFWDCPSASRCSPLRSMKRCTRIRATWGWPRPTPLRSS